MSVLVVGGAGYIGSHTVLALRGAGRDLLVLDDLSSGSRRLLPDDVALVQGDAGDAALLARLLREHRISAVIHFAGSIAVPDSIRRPLAYYRNNTCSSRTLIEACVTAGVERFIFSSTAAVYGTPDQLPVTEDAPLRPQSPYGRSKLMTELMLADAAAAHRLRYVALRYFNVAGADPEGRSGQIAPDSTNLLKVACETALGQRPAMEIFGTDYDTPDGTCIRDLIHVSDLADAHLQALRYLEAGGDSRVLNCGYGHGYSIREIIAAVEREVGRPLPARAAPRRPGDIVAMVADSSAIKTLCGWQARYDDLAVIVRTALAWERRWQAGDST